MGTNNLTVIRKPGNFTNPGTMQLARPAPASPVVLQMLMQSMVNLNQKVDALTLRGSQIPATTSRQTKLVESRDVQTESETHRRTKVNRSSLLDIFD